VVRSRTKFKITFRGLDRMDAYKAIVVLDRADTYLGRHKRMCLAVRRIDNLSPPAATIPHPGYIFKRASVKD